MIITDFIATLRKEPSALTPGLRDGDYLFSDCRLMLQHVMDNGLLPTETLRRKISIVDRRLAQAGLPTISGLSQNLILTEDELVKVTAPPTPPVMPAPPLSLPKAQSPANAALQPVAVDSSASSEAKTPSPVEPVTPPTQLEAPLVSQGRVEVQTLPNPKENLEEPDPKSVSKQDFIEVALEVHSALSALVAPATPTSLRATDPGQQAHSTTGMPRFLYRIMWLSFVSAILFLLTLPRQDIEAEKTEKALALEAKKDAAKKNEGGATATQVLPGSQPSLPTPPTKTP
ncbi:MAG: hypothetical protein ABL974_06825 [Prosthecobacter sp.]